LNLLDIDALKQKTAPIVGGFRKLRYVQGRTGLYGYAANATRLFFANAKLLRMRGILKIFPEKMRLFLISVRDF
jgi:hypothetical protein